MVCCHNRHKPHGVHATHILSTITLSMSFHTVDICADCCICSYCRRVLMTQNHPMSTSPLCCCPFQPTSAATPDDSCTHSGNSRDATRGQTKHAKTLKPDNTVPSGHAHHQTRLWLALYPLSLQLVHALPNTAHAPLPTQLTHGPPTELHSHTQAVACLASPVVAVSFVMPRPSQQAHLAHAAVTLTVDKSPTATKQHVSAIHPMQPICTRLLIIQATTSR